MQELFTFLVVLLVAKTNADPGDFRPPAVPLIVFSPHISGESNLYFTQDRKIGRRLPEQTHFYNEIISFIRKDFFFIITI
jgi:hypothetical protein